MFSLKTRREKTSRRPERRWKDDIKNLQDGKFWNGHSDPRWECVIANRIENMKNILKN